MVAKPDPSKLTFIMKKSFVLRIDEASFAALEKWAADDFRSVNGQIEWLLSRALKEAGRAKKVVEAQENGHEGKGEEPRK
jgi:hypothetical protein